MSDITKDDLIGKIQCLRQDIESVVGVLTGETTLADSWDIGDESNWNSFVTLLDDIESYLDDVTEGEVDELEDDIPPDDIGDIDDYKIQD